MVFIILLVTLIIGYIIIKQNKKILDNQEVIMLELNKLLVATKYQDE